MCVRREKGNSTALVVCTNVPPFQDQDGRVGRNGAPAVKPAIMGLKVEHGYVLAAVVSELGTKGKYVTTRYPVVQVSIFSKLFYNIY